jgi:hypothetical protein
MQRSRAIQGIAILMSCALSPAFAATVHKWVDADGVTHYSDEAPEPSMTQVTKIDVPEAKSAKAGVENEYYSIMNQWQRVHKERLEQEKLKLEQARQQATSQPATPEVVYVNGAYDDRYVVAYPSQLYRRHKHNRFYKKTGHRGNGSKRHLAGGKTPVGLHAGRLKLGSYRYLQ